jgi:choline dehydrogenase-like flavoprotein
MTNYLGSAVDPSSYVIVGGGTAGCILAARLSEDPSVTVALIEWGPSDTDVPAAGEIRRWAEMIEGEYDLDYRSVQQERGNSGIRQTRMRLLGGCSTTNTMISWKPLAADLAEWVELGADGWDADTVIPYFDRLATPITVIPPQDRNSYLQDVLDSAVTALGIPSQKSWNDHDFVDGAGYFEIGYTPETNLRSSTSRSYLHPLIGSRDNLTVVLQHRVTRILLESGCAVAVLATTDAGAEAVFRAEREILLCAGAIDSPRLLELSGIGPAAVLEAAGVDVILNVPGVGENLQDHAEGLIIWETREALSTVSATGWDAGYLVRVDPNSPVPEISTHIPLETWGVQAEAFTGTLPEFTVSLTPNISKPASRGRVWITDADAATPPSIDYRYFTDPDGHDERLLLQSIRNARLVAATEPMKSRLVREIFPGEEIIENEELSALLRSTHQTVYHVCGTCKMGGDDDPLAVVDARLRVRGISGLRVVDASVFPTIPSLNPVVTVMMVAERAADLIAVDYAEGTLDE